jgi:isoquinoline 1-oxidoreductase alpha subunit
MAKSFGETVNYTRCDRTGGGCRRIAGTPPGAGTRGAPGRCAGAWKPTGAQAGRIRVRTAQPAHPSGALPLHQETFMATFFVNKERVDIAGTVPGDTPLLWVLRDNLNLTGTKYGCGMALCGACTVYIEGQPVRSCQTPLSSIRTGAEITTIEGVKSKEAQAIQAAWEKLDVPQCGFCQSGQVMAAAALLAKKRKPTDADIDAAMSGNLCRCATYGRIRAAIKEAAKNLA